MEKKKLTDEEIIKALEFKREGRNEVVYIDGIERKIIKVTDILDFINRLQSENATLKSELKKELDEHEEFTKKAKAEIERLKEKFSISHYKDSWKNKFFKAQEKIERLTEENAELQKQLFEANVCATVLSQKNEEKAKEIERLTEESNEMFDRHAKELQAATILLEKRNKEIERLTTENKKLTEKNRVMEHNLDFHRNKKFELQKQVDELTAFKNEAISMSLYGKGRKDGEEVAVKETAKEILGVILAREFEKGDYLTDDELHELFKERYGVEVE